ncbi:MAG: esterase-like activity of phytase family protein [Stappiaceae bacterium]
MNLRRSCFTLAVALALSTPASIKAAKVPAAPTGLIPFEIRQQSLPHFRIGHRDQTVFGELEYLGGAELTSINPDFGALSGLLSLDNGQTILAVSDTGFWFTWEVPTGREQSGDAPIRAEFAPILDHQGAPLLGKNSSDAEALAQRFVDGQLEYLVAFEGDTRLDAWPAPPARAAQTPAKNIRTGIPDRQIRFNKGIEGLSVAPPGSPIAGAIIALTERSKNRVSNMNGWLIGGPLPGLLKVKRRDNYDVTDASFLPDGDLLLLERRFNISDGIGMRIRRVPASTIRPGAILDGPAIIEADLGYHIDNMEGLANHLSPQGETILTLVSDNNHSILQRTLILRFKLKGDIVRKAADPESVKPRAHPARDG